ncbi:MAG: hypothetical protein GX383_02920 [Clostridium sp.]|jgi:hypothetical protein|nr:hypothetical protein [Clostridium sp.]
MDDRLLRSIITIAIAVVLLIIAVRFLYWAVFKLLPIAIVIIAAYIVYCIVTGKKVF